MDELGYSVGEVAARVGIAPSAVRFYEDEGLISASRTEGNQRRFTPVELRRISVIRAAQAVGLTLGEIRSALDVLGRRRTPTAADWARMGEAWKSSLDERIVALERLRDDLDGCIGCGCLSLESCTLLNPGDSAGRRGPGPRFLLGDR
ncbi:MAG TPA: redox-sensitive transcriptional activator SoxR [Acidimicrobiia bacterium]|nr:redox-sensitive transcriptional activator SoxR [Acidimicrobiia bacterium]